MRSVSVELCGETLQLPVTFEAGELLAKAGFDPLEVVIAQEAGKPAVRTSAAVVTILYTGVTAAKSKLSRKQIGEAVVEKGVFAYLSVANTYLAAFLDAGPEHPAPPGNGEAA